MRIWEQFPGVFLAVKQDHNEVGLVSHHDFVHAARVGEIAYQIALNEWGNERMAQLAGISGLCHNSDRIIQAKLNLERKDPSPAEVSSLIFSQLGTDFTLAERDLIIEAVLKHEDLNSINDSPILISLMDADRVVNLDIDLFPRSGQYYSDLPVVDYLHFLNDPKATYRDPKTVLRDIAYSLDWVNPNSAVCIRTVLGQRMALRRTEIFRVFFEALKSQLEEEGVKPYPFGD